MIIAKKTFSGVPEGYDVLVLADLAKQYRVLFHITSDETHLRQIKESLALMIPDIAVWDFPAWDTVPYDRISPHLDIESTRLETLSKIANTHVFSGPTLILVSGNAVLQKV